MEHRSVFQQFPLLDASYRISLIIYAEVIQNKLPSNVAFLNQKKIGAFHCSKKILNRSHGSAPAIPKRQLRGHLLQHEGFGLLLAPR